MRYLSGREKKDLLNNLPAGYEISKKDEIVERDNILYKNGKPYLLLYEDENGNQLILPELSSINPSLYPKAFIDRGAIPFLLKGADMMRPGITRIDGDFKEGDIIIIMDDVNEKILGLGFSVYDSNTFLNLEKGKVIKVFQYFKSKK